LTSSTKNKTLTDNEKAVHIALALRHDEIMEKYYQKFMKELNND